MTTRAFPHRLYLSTAVALASGGFAMTAAVISGDADAMQRLLNAYIWAYRIAVVGVVGVALFRLLKGDP
jgi:hypothetical protein